MKKIIFGILIIAGTSQANVAGNAVAIQDWILAHTRFLGCHDSEISLIKDSLSQGLQTIHEINPNLLEDRLSLNNHRSVVFECIPNKALVGEAAAHAEIREWKSGFLGLFGKTKLLPEAKIRFARNVSDEWQGNENFQVKVDPRSVIFHEFLHFLQFDNLPLKNHNVPAVYYKYDVVYGCAEAAFPGSLESPYEAIENCRAATLVSNKPDILLSDVYWFDYKSPKNISVSCLVTKVGTISMADWQEKDFKKCQVK